MSDVKVWCALQNTCSDLIDVIGILVSIDNYILDYGAGNRRWVRLLIIM